MSRCCDYVIITIDNENDDNNDYDYDSYYG